MTASESLAEALETLSALHPKKIDLGLGRVKRVLKALGNPQYRLPPAVHIAGTNGKGSTLAMLRAMAEADGLKVHAYTSPHLVRFNERIVVESQQINDASLVDIITRVRTVNDGEPLSFFEATTAAMFLAFSESPADIALIEVGLGGRYDATNVFDPAICGITPIDYDHAEFLGKDLAGIAREKAGIMTPHVPVMIGKQGALVRAVLEAEADKCLAPIEFQDEHFSSYRQHGRLVYESDDVLLDLPPPALIGEHQIGNAGLSIALARHMQISDEAIAKGLQTAKWPARLQSITTGPLAEIAQKAGAELWLDGGHNPHAARAVAHAMAELETKSPRPLILITGILANKDINGFLEAYDGLATAIVGVSIPGHAALDPDVLAELAEGRGLIAETADHVTGALKQAVHIGEAINAMEEPPDAAPRILICGSLYLSGEVLKLQDDIAT